MTTDAVVRDEHRRQGAENVSVRNIITSLHLISDVDWKQLFERLSLVDAVLATGGDFESMDFPTRTLYRSAVEELSRGSNRTELEIASAAVLAAKRAGADAPATERARRGDTGYILLAGGRRAFEKAIAYRLPMRNWAARANRSLGVGGYVAAISLVAVILLAAPLLVLSVAGVGLAVLARLACLAPFPRSTPRLHWSIAQSTLALPRPFCRRWSYGMASPRTCARSSPCQRCSPRSKASKT